MRPVAGLQALGLQPWRSFDHLVGTPSYHRSFESRVRQPNEFAGGPPSERNRSLVSRDQKHDGNQEPASYVNVAHMI